MVFMLRKEDNTPMSKLIRGMSVLTILLLGGLMTGLFAQEGSHSGHQEEVSIVGCLDEGGDEGYFVLTDEDGEEIDVTGSAELGKHLGHKVRLTGTWVEEDEYEIFKVAKIEHISADCDY